MLFWKIPTSAELETEIAYLDKLIRNDCAQSYSQHMAVFTWMWKLMKQKIKSMLILSTNERKNAPISISTVLFTKSLDRWELGWWHAVCYNVWNSPVLFFPSKWFCVPCSDQIYLAPYICGSALPLDVFHLWGKFGGWGVCFVCVSAL